MDKNWLTEVKIALLLITWGKKAKSLNGTIEQLGKKSEVSQNSSLKIS